MGSKKADWNYRVNVVNPGGELKDEDVRLFAKWLLKWSIANGTITLPRRKEEEHEDFNGNLRERVVGA